jgi:hypothetical protein
MSKPVKVGSGCDGGSNMKLRPQPITCRSRRFVCAAGFYVDGEFMILSKDAQGVRRKYRFEPGSDMAKIDLFNSTSQRRGA